MNNISEVILHFQIEGQYDHYETIHSGLINATYHIYTSTNEYLLQKVNTSIFQDMEGLMNNIELVTQYLKNKNIKTLQIIKTKEGKLYDGDYRMYDYIPDSFSYDVCDSIDAFYLDGKCFGKFHHDLKDFHEPLVDTIPHFHDTPLRYESFLEAIQFNLANRVQASKQIIDTLMDLKEIAYYQMDQSDICHNDAKLANVLFDKNTKEAICIIDLDTMMMGSIGYDFGDAIRSGCNSLKEDDDAYELIDFDLDYFYAFTNGFLEGLKEYNDHTLDQLEKGIYVIIYEQAIRFFTDYLNGDTYYATQYPAHNLVRTKNQIALLKKAIEKKETIHQYMESKKGQSYENCTYIG